MFRLHDATVDPDGPGSPAPPGGAIYTPPTATVNVAKMDILKVA